MVNSRRPQREPSRIGSFLAAIGCLGVLGLTFAGGVYTGRYWTRASLTPAVPDTAAATTGPAPALRAASAVRPAPPLTFYEELTVPLSPPTPGTPGEARRAGDKADPREPRRAADRPDPGVPRRAADKADLGEPRHRAERDPAAPRQVADKADPGPVREDATAARKDTKGPDASARQSEPASGRFTVQVAAYSARASAEALRNTISASGHEAYIVETADSSGAPRYRVRVGSYPSREAALAAASRLPVPGERYVVATR